MGGEWESILFFIHTKSVIYTMVWFGFTQAKTFLLSQSLNPESLDLGAISLIAGQWDDTVGQMQNNG